MPGPRDSRQDWARFSSSAIPTKTRVPHLERLLRRLSSRVEAGSPSLLDLGCGVGRLSRRCRELGFSVVGVDINRQAVAQAVADSPSIRFHVKDIASRSGLALEEAPFRIVVCQLVLSVVGGPEQRRALVENAFHLLEPEGTLYLSASGASHEINHAYARLYEEDHALTGERFTYFSRDDEGNVLYATHHFVEEELRSLLSSAGFEDIEIRKEKEASSRRPRETAYFFYATCRKPSAQF